MKKYSILFLLLLLGGCGRAPEPAASSSAVPTQNLELAGVQTVMVERKPIQAEVRLPGQVNLTEAGQASITAPLNGVVVDLLVRAGQHVNEGAPLAVINSIYGQTGLQILKNLESDQTAVVQAQANVTSAEGNLGGAESTLSQARSALEQARIAHNQAVDTLDQAKSEMLRARIDLKRKRDLFTAGVFARGDVEDAQERHDKAVSAWHDAARSLSDAVDSVRLAEQNVHVDQQNVSNFRANVAEGQKAVVLARANMDRDKTVFGQASLSGTAVSQNLTPVRLEGGRYSETAAANATMFSIRAPFSGTVTTMTMTKGLSVSPGTALATLVNDRQVYVDANAFEADLGSIHAGDPVSATVPAYPALTFHGRVKVVGKQVDPTTRTVAVRSLIDNPQGNLKAGMFATATLRLERPQMALVVPDSAILVHGDDRYVFVQSTPGHFEKRAVKIGVASQGQTEVVSGIQAGDVVVTAGNILLESQE